MDEPEKRLPVTHLVQQDLSTCNRIGIHRARKPRPHAAPIGLRRDVVEALRPQEEAAARRQAPPLHVDALMEDGMGIPRGERVVGSASLCVEAIRDRHGLEQGRLARSVLTDEKRDVRIECKRTLAQRRQCGDAAQVLVSMDELPQNRNGRYEKLAIEHDAPYRPCLAYRYCTRTSGQSPPPQ